MKKCSLAVVLVVLLACSFVSEVGVVVPEMFEPENVKHDEKLGENASSFLVDGYYVGNIDRVGSFGNPTVELSRFGLGEEIVESKIPIQPLGDYPHDSRGEITDIIVTLSTCYPTETQEIYVQFRNPTSTTYHYLVVVNILDPSDSVIYDSHLVGADRHGYVSGGNTVTWGPWSYILPSDAEFGTYHVLAGLRLYPWEPELDYMGLSWCEPEITFTVMTSDEYFDSVELVTYDDSGDCIDDAVHVRIDADTTDRTQIIVVKAYLYSPGGSQVDYTLGQWQITGTGDEWNILDLQVPSGSSVGWYDIVLKLYDSGMRLEDTYTGARAYLYPPDYNSDETIDKISVDSFDSNSDGYNDAVHARVDIDTSIGCFRVTVRAYLYNPSGTQVDDASSSWDIQDSNDEWHTLNLYVPSCNTAGWYDVEWKVWDEYGNFEDSNRQNDCVYLYPPDYEPQLDVSPTILDFGTMDPGETAQKSFTVKNTGKATLNWEASEPCSWVTSVSPSSGSLGAGQSRSVTVHISTSNLSPGQTYTCPISITSNGGSETVTVKVTIAGPPQYLVTFQQSGCGDTPHVTVEGEPHILPYSVWVDSGSSLTFSFESPVTDGENEWVLTSTSHSSPITITEPTTTITGYYSLSGEIELYYDDGVAEDGYAPTSGLYWYSVHFQTPTATPYKLSRVKYYIYSSPASFYVDIRDASLQQLYYRLVTPAETGWFVVDLASEEIFVEGDFYVAIKYSQLYEPKLGADTSNPDGESGEDSYSFPTPNISSLDWMIRAVLGENQPPTADNLAISPSSPVTADDLVASYDYYDADGDPESGSEIRWYKNSILQPAYNDQLTVPYSATAKGQTWYFTLRPKDGKEFGDLETSPSVTVGNTPPTASNPAISPLFPATTSDLVATYDYYDADGDPESGSEIRWYKNSILQPAYNNKRTVPFTATSTGEAWYFSVRPKDGTEFGTIKTSETVTIISYYHIGAETSQTHEGIIAEIEVTDPDVQIGTNNFFEAWIMVFDRGDPNDPDDDSWFQVGWIEYGGYGNDQYVFTEEYIPGSPRDHQEHMEYSISPSMSIQVRLTFVEETTWAAWLWWNDQWQLLDTANMGFSTPPKTAQSAEVYIIEESPFYIPDTSFYNTKLLVDGVWHLWDTTYEENTVRFYEDPYRADWQEKYWSWYAYYQLSELSIMAESPVNLLVTDPIDRRIGYDSETGTVVNEIPNATYSGPGSEPQLISIPSPLTGNYTVDAFGTGTGAYTITMQSIASNGSIIDTDIWQGTAVPDEQYSETVRLDSEGRLTWPHDIEIMDIMPSKTVVGQGYCVNITVVITNWGDFAESFNVSVFYDDTIITLPDGKNHTTTTLPSGDSTTITFTWNTTGVAKGNYTITAKATPLPYETDTLDNNLTDGWIIVAMAGDLSGPEEVPDGLVDIDDVVFVAVCFGSYPSHENWNINADITNDGIVDIDDVTIPAIHFGEYDP